MVIQDSNSQQVIADDDNLSYVDFNLKQLVIYLTNLHFDYYYLFDSNFVRAFIPTKQVIFPFLIHKHYLIHFFS